MFWPIKSVRLHIVLSDQHIFSNIINTTDILTKLTVRNPWHPHTLQQRQFGKKRWIDSQQNGYRLWCSSTKATVLWFVKCLLLDNQYVMQFTRSDTSILTVKPNVSSDVLQSGFTQPVCVVSDQSVILWSLNFTEGTYIGLRNYQFMNPTFNQ